MTKEEEAEILEDFSAKLISSQEDLKPEYDKFVSEHFWELI
jgi:hypothetical protein